MSRGELLIELLCEEIPANALPGVRAQLVDSFTSELGAAGFNGFAVSAYSTVRRLVVHASDLAERQPDREEDVLGPSLKAAYAGDGSPTQAALGFARAHGVEIGALRVVRGPKGEVIAATRRILGRPTAEVVSEIAVRVIPSLHFPRRMRWGAGEHVFVRPLHGIAALLGEERLASCVPLELLGVASGTATVGHRVAAPAAIELRGVAGFAGYQARLAAAGVVLDPVERRRRLVERADALAHEVGCEVRPDPELVDELVELVEYPGVVRGAIDPRFLELPKEVLITSLRHHQKALVLTRGGRVAPYFLAVCDRADDPAGAVRQGNEWVVGARLADAAFFFAQDRSRPLAQRRAELDRVTFHAKLGSYLTKTEIVSSLAAAIAAEADLGIAPGGVARACELAKVDLATAMVGEFPELQGIIGGIYACLDGEPDEVWQAIADQYTPAGLDGVLPRGPVAAVVGLADRLDSLAGLFAAGEIPSGSRDPFALRRAALAAVRICAELPLRANLREATARALVARSAYLRGEAEEAQKALADFLLERVRYYLTAVAGVSGGAADAVLHAGWGVIPDDVSRARALEAVRQEPVFGQLAVAFKRVRNILSRSGGGRPDRAALQERADAELAATLDAVGHGVAAALAAHDFAQALRLLAELAAPLDRFFTDVLVLCEDEVVRGARLALLAEIEQLFLRLADLSFLSGQA